MEYTYKFLNIPYWKVVWFNKNKNFIPKDWCLYTLRQSVKLDIPKKYIIFENEFYTTVIDLTKDLDEIWYKFDKKSTRYEIKKAMKFIDKIRILENENYEQFFKMGNEYYFLKYGINKKFNITEILSKKRNHYLLLAYYDNDLICGAFYIYDSKKERIRLNYSFSKYLFGKEYSHISSFLNKYLHWYAIQKFKNEGFKLYDFGGINLNKNSKTYGITKFKLSFGGDIVKEYDYLIHKKGCILRQIINNHILRNLVVKLPIKKPIYG